MLYRVYGPIAAEPVLHLALQHVARSPAARLGIVYNLVARRPLPPAEYVLEAGVRYGGPVRPGAIVEQLANRSIRGPYQLPLNLGQAIYLDSILAGGVDGQTLPLSMICCRATYLPRPPVGTAVDIAV